MAKIESTSPSRLQDFEILGRLGKGSFGVVFKVRRKLDGEIYVLKQINIAAMSIGEQRDAVNEVQILASLDHPNIVQYFDSFLDNDCLNIIMEFCDRGDLSTVLRVHSKESRRMLEDRIWHLFLQMAIGLHYLHSQKILHRDFKSANVFLCSVSKVGYIGHVVKIGDLGVARVLNSTNSFAQTLVGTPYYLSPELCQDKPYNEKTDVWALGVVLYECCTLRHPFDARNQGALILKIVQGKFPPIDNTYSSNLRRIVHSCLTRNVENRPTIADILSVSCVQEKAAELGISLPSNVLVRAARPQSSRLRSVTNETKRFGSSSNVTTSKSVRGNRIRGGTPTDRTKPSNVRIRTKASANKRNITKPMPQEEQVQDIEQREKTSPQNVYVKPSQETLVARAEVKNLPKDVFSKRPTLSDLLAITANDDKNASTNVEALNTIDPFNVDEDVIQTLLSVDLRDKVHSVSQISIQAVECTHGAEPGTEPGTESSIEIFPIGNSDGVTWNIVDNKETDSDDEVEEELEGDEQDGMLEQYDSDEDQEVESGFFKADDAREMNELLNRQEDTIKLIQRLRSECIDLISLDKYEELYVYYKELVSNENCNINDEEVSQFVQGRIAHCHVHVVATIFRILMLEGQLGTIEDEIQKNLNN